VLENKIVSLLFVECFCFYSAVDARLRCFVRCSPFFSVTNCVGLEPNSIRKCTECGFLFYVYNVSPGGVMVRAFDLRLKKSHVRISAVPFSANNLGQVVHTCASVTKQYNLVPVKGWLCPGIALAMRHRLQWFIHLRAYGLRKRDEHPAYIPHGV